MTSAEGDERAPIRVVLADANVLYSRVLRDYLLYAATQGVLEIRWSAEILAEVVEHLAENIAGFDVAAGARLVSAMNGAFPAAEVEPDSDAQAAVAGLPLPDADDRHVLAAAVAVDADAEMWLVNGRYHAYASVARKPFRPLRPLTCGRCFDGISHLAKHSRCLRWGVTHSRRDLTPSPARPALGEDGRCLGADSHVEFVP